MHCATFYKFVSSVCFLSLMLIVGCNNDDPGPGGCRVHGLQFNNDSTVYSYDNLGRIEKVAYFDTGLKTKEDLFTYNAQGKLSVIEKERLYFDGSRSSLSHYEIEYDGNGIPLRLVTSVPNSPDITTTFTHDDDRRLVLAETTVMFPSTGETSFVGAARYEYDVQNNIPHVFYTVNVLGTLKEVLARENTRFDDKEKFYATTPELKIANEYVYGYLPAKNNCLASNVIYYSYSQRFTSPLSVTFEATYTGDGKIKSLKNTEVGNQLYSGDVLFTNVTYTCN